MSQSRSGPRDMTVVILPLYFVFMAVEHLWLRRRAAVEGTTALGYERRDTVASVAVGVGSLVAPPILTRLLRPFTPGQGRYGNVLVKTALGAAVVTTVADVVARRASRRSGEGQGADDHRLPTGAATEVRPLARLERRDRCVRWARQAASVGGVAAVVAGGIAVTTTWASRTTPDRLWRRKIFPSSGTGPLALAVAVAGWDFIYYWNHRFMHESRYMWAVHVVHHSSERYNLSTAVRQPVADVLGTTVPYGTLCLLGIEPDLIVTARAINLLYQYWIHTETIDRLGPPESVLNTPSHHRVHHGSNARYIDRNHGSILIVWDRLFGTFEPEDERAVYGLTKNIDTFNLGRIMTHEYADMLRDVARSTGWTERLSYVLRGPGWATRHRAQVSGDVDLARSETDLTGRRDGIDAIAVSAVSAVSAIGP